MPFDQLKMLRMILSSLLAKSPCSMYPFKRPETFPATRGSIGMAHPDTCILCSLCARKCPPEAIAVSKEARTWRIDRLRCIACGACVEACPKKCLSMLPSHTPPSTGPSAETVDIPKPPAKNSVP